MKYLIPILALLAFTYCNEINSKTESTFLAASTSGIAPHDEAWYKTIGDIPLPEGYQRLAGEEGSFAHYLRSLPLKQKDNTVTLYNGIKKHRQDVQFAVLTVDVGDKDLQQCADAVMRLRAEYLYSQKRYEDIHFNFTNGDRVNYTQYADGYRASISGNDVSWSKRAEKDYTYPTFRKYMDLVFTYAGSYSLQQELNKVSDYNTVLQGDVFIQGGFPGHAVIVADVAQHTETGERIFMLAQSYMPAQEIHILKNPNSDELNPWYSTQIGDNLPTAEWNFTEVNLKRF